jgi:hypothetical protein
MRSGEFMATIAAFSKLEDGRFMGAKLAPPPTPFKRSG